MNIALIDDHQIIVDGYKAILVIKEIEVAKNIHTISSIADAIKFVNFNIDNNTTIDLFVIDYNMPIDNNSQFKNGEELALYIKKLMPSAKIVMLTSVSTPLLLFDMIEKLNPDGLWLKSDINQVSFLKHITNVLEGNIVFSESVKKAHQNVMAFKGSIDENNRKILLLLNDGVKTKYLPEHIHLSIDTINHRKANLKTILGLDSGDDYELVKRAKMLGLL